MGFDLIYHMKIEPEAVPGFNTQVNLPPRSKEEGEAGANSLGAENTFLLGLQTQSCTAPCSLLLSWD